MERVELTRVFPLACGWFAVSGPKWKRLENIDEENVHVVCAHPETPTESMEFLARSWSVSALELTKALCTTTTKPTHHKQATLASESPPQPESPRGSDDAKELLVLHQALNPEFISHQQLRLQPIYRTIIKKKTMGRWMKDHKERKKQEIRAHNAQLHAAVSAAGVAAAVAALSASSLSSPEKSKTKKPSRKPAAIASAAALVASHCIEIAEDLGADRDHVLAVVKSAINAKTNGDVMTLTAAAATALRGAATMRARLHRDCGGPPMPDDTVWNGGKESSVSTSLNFVCKGGELLKRTRKGDLHWKQVSFNINYNWQVVVKMKSKHIGGTFTKKKKCVVSGIYSDIRAWPGREMEGAEQMAYFAVQTEDRVIEFECRNKDWQMWVEGIQSMLHLHDYM